MKQFFAGLAVGATLSGLAAYAVSVQVENFSVRDLYATAALPKIMEQETTSIGKSYTIRDNITTAYRYADEAIKQRGNR
jgi:hypothetical protein